LADLHEEISILMFEDVTERGGGVDGPTIVAKKRVNQKTRSGTLLVGPEVEH